MSAPQGKTALITGANVGIGKEVARQLALRPEIGRIYLACRNKDRATAAKADLEAVTGRHIFDIILMDVADLGSVRAGLVAISGSLDALVMNAGVIGNKSLMELTTDGVTELFATNVLGHAVLLEGLLTQNRLREVAVFAASEAARGIPKLGFKRPTFVSTSADELTAVIDGSYFAGRKYDRNLAFGQVKYIGALWMAHLARVYPDLRFITVSPGNTTGTQAADGAALPLRFVAKHIMPHLGISHELEVGSKRLVDGVIDPTLSSGVFYASAADKLTGPLVDQADILPDFANLSFQDNANEALHRFITRPRSESHRVESDR
jgi:NAD(P)-dependent dehydrogenase (short-subunit alcohol dehydrogenase family)